MVSEFEFIEQLFKNAGDKMYKFEDMNYVAQLQGIDVTSIRNLRQRNKTLLHVATGLGRKSWVEGLIINGADVNAQDDEGQAPLHAACNHAHRTVANLLLEAGANVNLVDGRGWPPLHFAISRRVNAKKIQPHYWEVIELLLNSGADPRIRSKSKKSSFDRVKDIEQKAWILILFILNERKHCDNLADEEIINEYLSPLVFFELLIDGDEHLEMFKILTTTKLLRSRLANCDNITHLHRAAGRNHLAVAQLFIELGADVNATDDDGCLPLHNAAQWGHVEMIELLISEGSDINRQDLYQGFSPLHAAATNTTFHACLKLRELGANLNLRDNSGALPYDLAKSSDIKEVLKPELLKMVRTVHSTSEQAIYIGYQEDSITEPSHQLYTTTHDTLMLDSTSDERLFSNPKHQIKKIILDKKDIRYKLVKKRMRDTIVYDINDLGGRFKDYEIISVEYILHEKVRSKYRLMCQRLEIDYGQGSKNERLLFHGSNFIDKIQACGFDECYAQRNGMFGAGIYFAVNSSKSNQYTFGWGQGCQEHNNKSCYVCERKMIYAQVALGRSLRSREAMPDCAHAPPGYSSVAGLPGTFDELVYPEYVIYNGDQAYPLFVNTYRIKP